MPEDTKPKLPEGYLPVTSSNIKAIGFFSYGPAHISRTKDPLVMLQEGEREGRLEILFNNGGRWAYENVDPMKADELLKAESVGRYFNANIKAKPEEHAPSMMEAWRPEEGE